MGVTYTISFYHKGGSGTVDFLPNSQPPPSKEIIVNNDTSWTYYSDTWIATHRNMKIVITDDVDTQKSYFDNVSFTTPGFSERNGYNLVLSGDMEWWGRDGGDLPADAWRTIGAVNVSQAFGYSGFYCARFQSITQGSGIYTNIVHS